MLKLITHSHQSIYLGKNLDTDNLERTYDYKFYVGRITRGVPAYAIVSVYSSGEKQITEEDMRVNHVIHLKGIATDIRLLSISKSIEKTDEVICASCGKITEIDAHLHTLDALWSFDMPKSVLAHRSRRGIKKKGKKWMTNNNSTYR